MKLVDAERLREIAEVEFADIVAEAFVPDANELRIIFTDGSFVDVWFSLKLTGRYSYHWERRAVDGTIYRHDNAPHKRWLSVATFPNIFNLVCSKLRPNGYLFSVKLSSCRMRRIRPWASSPSHSFFLPPGLSRGITWCMTPY